MNYLIYDCEIIKAIPNKNGERIDGIEYCDGWRDFANMGISVIGAYDMLEARYRVFCRDNFAEFAALAKERSAVSFNGIGFDDRLCAANGIEVFTDYDLLVRVWNAAGLGDEFKYPSHAGYGLDAICQANGIGAKSGNGALAPVLWQQGSIGEVIDYCLQDVALTTKLFQKALAGEPIKSPKDGALLTLARPPVKVPE